MNKFSCSQLCQKSLDFLKIFILFMHIEDLQFDVVLSLGIYFPLLVYGVNLEH